jgi:hypothetical protein
MKIYLAGQCPYPTAKAYADEKHGRFLYSYIYMKNKKPAVLRRAWQDQDIMLDSGGFSVRVSGGSVSVVEYRKFLNTMQGSFRHCLNLDTKDVSETLRNQSYLEELQSIARPMPVYHFSDFNSRENRGLLQRYIDHSYDFIGIGGVAGLSLSKEQLKSYFDFCFQISGKHTKLHGLGMTSMRIMAHYPFYSCDSKTWLVSGLYGDYVTTTAGRYKRTAKKRGSISHHGIMLPGPEKMKRAVDAFISMERQLTANWAKKGYTWT